MPDPKAPTHGQYGDRHITTRYGESGHTASTVWGTARWCATCREWQVPTGIVSLVIGAVCCPTCKRDWRDAGKDA